jgi:branched-chain amino acid transport system permease protein
MRILKNFALLGGLGAGLFALLWGLISVGVIDDYTLQILCSAGLNIMVALSLNLISGFTGQLALGHAGFLAVGAYSTGILLLAHVPFPLAILGGALITALLGFLIGFPALRLRGDYLAIVTLGVGEIIRVLIINLGDLTGGASGLRNVPGYAQNIMVNNPAAFLWIFPAVFLSVALVANLIQSSQGRTLISIREDEVASQAMGVNIFGMKLMSFTLSAFIAGLAGALYAPFIGYLAPGGFDFLRSVFFVIIVVLGGMGSLTGTILSGIGLTFLQEALRTNAKDWSQAVANLFGTASGGPTIDFVPMSQVLFGLILIILMIFRPEGLLGSRELRLTKLLRRGTR